MNLNFENPQDLWSTFSKHFARTTMLLGEHEDPTHIPRKIEDREFVSDAFEESYLSLEAELRKKISTISTYHACKVIDESSYREKGIRKLRTIEAIEWMKNFFQLQNEVDTAVNDLERKLSGYSARSQSEVYTMCSMTDSEQRGLSYKHGCEFIRYTAKLLGGTHHQKYLEAGSPCYIESRTSLAWFDENTHNEDFSILVRHLLSHWLLIESNEHYYAKDRMNCAVIFDSDIPAMMIHNFHYQTNPPTRPATQ